MRVWSVANQKGGVGKTTTTVALGGLLAEKNQRVLLLDLDPHGSMTGYFNLDNNGSQGVYGLFADDKNIKREKVLGLIQKTNYPNLDILTASLALATLDKVSGKKSAMGLVVSKALETITEDYNFVLIDCPPIMGVLMVNALAASQMVVVPTQTEHLALKGLDCMIETMRMVARSRQGKIDCVIVPTLFDRRTRAAHIALNKISQRFGPAVWEGTIPIDTKLRDASLRGVPPGLYEPSTKGVWAYSSLLKHLLMRQIAEQRAELESR